MARIFGKIRGLMLEDDEYENDDYDDYNEEEEIKPQRSSVKENNPSNKNKKTNVYPIDTRKKLEIVLMQSACYEDAQKICDQIKLEKPVVVNLEKVEYQVAQRIMDFLSGTCYALDGSIQKVANNIFVIAPSTVEVSSDIKEEIKSVLPWAVNA